MDFIILLTPSHVDDIIVMYVSSLVYVNMGSGGTYWGLGLQSSTATNFSANRNMFYQTGQHSWGNGASGQGDHYENCTVTQQFDVSDIGFKMLALHIILEEQLKYIVLIGIVILIMDLELELDLDSPVG